MLSRKAPIKKKGVSGSDKPDSFSNKPPEVAGGYSQDEAEELAVSDYDFDAAARSTYYDMPAVEDETDLSEYVDRELTKQDNAQDVFKNLFDSILKNPLNLITLAITAVSHLIAKTGLNRYFDKRQKNSLYDSKTGLYKKKPGQYNEKQDLQAVNPGYMDANANSKNNCMLCTTTYDLRQRGYDVTAQLDQVGYNLHDLKKWYPDVEVNTNDRFDDYGRAISTRQYIKNTIRNIEKQGEGARGNIMVTWASGGAHSMIYEVKNGKAIIKDGQTGEIYNNPEDILQYTVVNSYARLDNIDPDMDAVIKDCVR